MPVTHKTSVHLLDLLRPKEGRPPNAAKGSRGSPDEFDGLLERIRKTDGTQPTERPEAAKASESPSASESVPTTPTSTDTRPAPRVELTSASRTATPAETPDNATAPKTATTATPTAPSTASPSVEPDASEMPTVAKPIPTTDISTLTPDEIEAVLKERDALAAMLAKATPVPEDAQTVAPVADAATSAEPLLTDTTPPSAVIVASRVDADVAVPPGTTPLAVASVPPPAETPLAVAPEPSSPTTEATPLFTTASPKVGKDYPAVLTGEERISTSELLRALQATVLGEESSDDAPVTWRSDVLAASEGSERTRLVVPETPSEHSVLRTLGVKALLDGNPADARLTTTPSSLLRSASGKASVKTLAGTIPVLESPNPTGAPNRETTSANAGSSVEGATRLTGSPLQRAQEAILRRAARVAFLERNATTQSAEMTGVSRQTPRLDSEPMVREMARALDRPTESLVRAERARARVRSSEPSESGIAASEWNSPEHTSRVASQSATPPVTATSPPVTSASVAATPQAYAPLMEQVAQEARRNVRLGKREFRIQLNPANLGSVQLEVVWDHDIVKVKITAASKESQKILEENVVELEQALQRQGLGFDADLPWKASDDSPDADKPPMDLRSARWTPAWRPGLTVTR
jgi:hypothetical protein